jgi:hypothetical protein
VEKISSRFSHKFDKANKKVKFTHASHACLMSNAQDLRRDSSLRFAPFRMTASALSRWILLRCRDWSADETIATIGTF